MPGIQEIQPARASVWHGIFAQLESSLAQKPSLWAYLFLAVGCLVRVWHASGTFLNSDEVMHFAAANQQSWTQTYAASLSLSHPPLLIFILHLWRLIGTSELVLRMPSILAGLAFCWFSFRWAQMLFSTAVAWVVYAFVLFLPTSIELSSEIRQYALLLAFAMMSAYLLEAALARNSAGAMLLSSVSLWLAISSHFSAFLFAATLGIYAIWRMLVQRPGYRVLAAWIVGQLVAVTLCVFFYVTQIRRLSQYFGGQDPTRAWMANSYLGHSYFVPGKVNPLLFILGRTIGVFQYTFRQLVTGDIAFLFFVAGIVLVLRTPRNPSGVNSRQLGVLLLLPFAVNCSAALLRAYPYGGTRHSSFLLPFALAGVSVSLARTVRSRTGVEIAAALLICVACRLTTPNKVPYFNSTDEHSSKMQGAIDFIRGLPREAPLFADFQTNLMLGHYLCNQQPVVADHSIPGFISFECGGHRVIASTTKYVFDKTSFRQEVQEMRERYRLVPESRIWIAQMGWNGHLATELAHEAIEPQSFGSEIQVFQFKPDQIPENKPVPAT